MACVWLPYGIRPDGVSDEGGEDHRLGCEKPGRPDERAPGAPAPGIGRNIEDAGHQIDPGAGLRHRGGLVAERDDDHGEGEEDQPFEMVVHRTLQAGGSDGERL